MRTCKPLLLLVRSPEKIPFAKFFKRFHTSRTMPIKRMHRIIIEFILFFIDQPRKKSRIRRIWQKFNIIRPKFCNVVYHRTIYYVFEEVWNKTPAHFLPLICYRTFEPSFMWLMHFRSCFAVRSQ